MAVSVMLYIAALACAPRMLFANSQLQRPVAKFFSARSAARLSLLMCRPPDTFSDKLPGSEYTEPPRRSAKNGLRNPPEYGSIQRKSLKAVLPASDAIRTVLPVTCHGSSPQSYRASRSVPWSDMIQQRCQIKSRS